MVSRRWRWPCLIKLLKLRSLTASTCKIGLWQSVREQGETCNISNWFGHRHLSWSLLKFWTVNFFKPQSPQYFGCQILFSVQVDYGRRTTYCGVSIWITISNGNIKACSLLSPSSIQTLKYYDWSRNLQEAGWGVGVRQRLDWYSQDREMWHALVNAVINLQVP